MKPWHELKPAEKIEAVKAVWFDGASSRQIAERVGAPSRNSVISVFHRNQEALKQYPLRTIIRRPKMSEQERKAREADRVRRYRSRKRRSNVITLHIPTVKKALGDQTRGIVPVKTVEVPRFRVVRNNVDMMVKDFLAKHGARRFERGATTEYVAVVNFLREHGHELKCASACYKIDGKPTSWVGVLAMVDEIRTRKGLEPIVRKSA